MDSLANCTMMIIKPDAVSNGKMGSIIYELEELGYKVEDIAFTYLEEHDVRSLYNMHESRPTFQGLVDFMIDGPSLLLIIAGHDENTARDIAGMKDEIRTRVATNETVYHNAVHISDSAEDARREIEIFFGY